MNLTELSKTIRFDNASKGFDLEGDINKYLLLAISEICEAQNELRDGRKVDEIYYKEEPDFNLKEGTSTNLGRKPCGFPVEIADAIIRLLDICGKFEVEVNTGGYWVYHIPLELDKCLLDIVKEICSFHIYGSDKENAKISVRTIGKLIWLSEQLEIDIMKVIQEKLKFNRSRPP